MFAHTNVCLSTTCLHPQISTRTDQGDRAYMEDEYLIKEGGRFAAVFDGHGGSDVSRYLRQNLYSKLQDHRKRKQWEDHDTPSYGSLSSHVTALRRAFEQVDREVCAMDYMSHQGSTAVAVSMHEEKDGRRILLSANVGDSRAVLCRNGGAVDLTRDHKPNCDRERARLEAMGETVEYDPLGQCWRVRNLSLSRAIGDKTSKPAVTGQVEIQQFTVTDGDEFIILGSDGLWDVMSSQDAVTFVRNRLNATPPAWDGNELERIAYARRMTMSKELVQEALKNSRKFGPAADNICVVVVWLNKSR
jgi:serine/threonine protein phosphatase PrpC